MKITFVSALLFFVVMFASRAHGQEFTLTTSPTNIISSKASIARPGLDGNPQAIIVATPLGDAEKNNPHPIGAWYYKDKWNIFNTDHAVMPVNIRYKIEYSLKPDANHFLHVLTTQNIGDDGSYLDHPLLDGHPNAVVKILQNHAPDNRGHSLNGNLATVTYNAAAQKWYIANVNGRRLYPNTAYSVAIYTDGTESTVPATPPAGPARSDDLSQRSPAEPVRSNGAPQTVPQRTQEPVANVTRPQANKAPGGERLPDPVGAPPIESSRAKQTARSASSGGPCTNEDAYRTVGKWGKQRPDDLAMADRTFSRDRMPVVLSKAQKAIDLFMKANPEFLGMEASAYRGVRGDPHFPGGPVPFRAEIGYKSFICLDNNTASVDKRGTIILYGGYGTTVVQFNSLRDVLDTVMENRGFTTAQGDEIYEYKRDLGSFRGMTLIEPFVRDEEHHEAVIITQDGRLPYKPVTREQFLHARIKHYRTLGGNFDSTISALNNALSNMPVAERRSPAIVRDIDATPGVSRLFATEAEGGRHLVIVDKGFFVTAPRETIQLITVHWYESEKPPPKSQMLRSFKQNFDFEALKQMLGK